VSGILEQKRLLVTGVVTDDSIAHAVAAAALREGAELLLTSFDRDRERTEATAELLAKEADVRLEVLELDVTRPEHFDRLRDEVAERWGRLDGALHAVAFAPRAALSGRFVDGDLESAQRAFATSTWSYAALARVLADLAPPSGGSIVGLDFDAAGAWPVYNWMGVCKAGLESASRYVARDLGPRGIRSNLVAAGPLHTRAASGIADFDQLTGAWDARSPMRWDTTDPAPVADAVVFLLSDLARAVSGEILHVDGGYHAMA